ncbi:MAG TPA: cytochrome c [Bryobacteraceae bacterium]|jgi:ubiquinol-cytochrome c reductase cytochrome c subunit
MNRLLLIAALAAAAYGQAQTVVPSGNAQKGKQLFQSYGCYQCHGREAQGEAGTGPRLAPKPIPFAALSKYVRQPTGQMPPYTNRVVSDADLANIYAFLSAQPAPPQAKSIPLLNY